MDAKLTLQVEWGSIGLKVHFVRSIITIKRGHHRTNWFSSATRAKCILVKGWKVESSILHNWPSRVSSI